MSDFNNNSDNQEFIKKLELLRDLEAEKPVEEMDVSLIKACVELILELRGETVSFTPEEVKEKVRKIPFVEETSTLNTPPKSVKGRSTKVKSRKILLIAAIISILVAIFTISSIAFDWNIFDELKNRFGTVADAPVNEEMKLGKITVISNGKTILYDDVEKALKAQNLDVLYLYKAENGLLLNRLSVYKDFDNLQLDCIYNDSNFIYSVTINKKLSDEIKSVATEIIKIDNLECFFIVMDDIGETQVYFEYDNNLYYMKYNNKQDLIEVIENLKELQ